MALSDTLKLIITADGTQASSQFKKVGADAKTSLSQAEGGSSKLTAALGLLGPAAVAAGAAAVAFGKSSIDTYQNVGTEVLKLQRYTGGTAEETSKLRFAMQQAGIDVDGAAKAMGIFSKNISNTPQVLSGYGIATTDASGKTLSFHEILLNTAEQFQRMPNGAQKTAEALKLFGRAGADMIPFLNRGRDGIADLEKQTSEYGMVLSGKNLADIKANKEAQRELTAAVQGLQVELGQKLLPALTQTTHNVTALAKALGTVPGLFDKLNSSTHGWYNTLLKSAPGPVGQALQMKDLSDKIDGVGKSQKNAEIDTQQFALSIGATTGVAQKFLDQQKEQGTTFKDTSEAQKAYTAAVADGSFQVDGATDSIVSYTDAMKNLNDAEHALFDPQFALMDAIQKLNDLQKSGTASSEDLAKAALDVDTATRTLAAGMENGSISVDKTRNTLDAWVRSGALTAAQANEVANQLGIVAAKADAVNGKTVTVTVLTQFANSVVDLQTVVGGGGHQIRAYGGPVHRGESYIVGDRRGMDTAEMFTPSQDGYITPSANGGGSSPATVNVWVGGEQVAAVVTSKQRYDARGRR